MSSNDDKPPPNARGGCMLAVVIAVVAALVVYFVFPGFLLGIALRCGVTESTLKRAVPYVIPIQFYLARRVNAIGSFYEWQISLVRG